MVDILFAAHEHNIDVVEAACAENLEAGWPGCGLSPTVFPSHSGSILSTESGYT